VQATSITTNLMSPTVTLGMTGRSSEFQPTAISCKSIVDMIWQNYPNLLEQDLTKNWFDNNDKNNAVKPLVLVPPITSCCGQTFPLRSSASFTVVFTESGTLVAAVFHGSCSKCSTSFWYSYKESKDGERTYFDPTDVNAPYFQYSRETVFSKKYLLDVTNNITFSGASFISRAEVYNASNFNSDCEKLQNLTAFGRAKTGKTEEDWKLSEYVIGNAWFLWSIVNIYQQYNVLEQKNIPCTYTAGRHRDFEDLCGECLEFVKLQPNKWVKHVCRQKGCQEGYITVDGNCKLRRPICASKAELTEVGPGLPKVMRCCRNTPVLGNQSKTANKFCTEHQHLNSADTGHAVGEVELDIGHSVGEVELMDSGNTESIQEIGCKKDSNILKYYKTTAGILALIKPCGIVVDICEMYTSESLSQVFIFILQTFCKPSQTPDYFTRFKYLGYDRACQFHLYLINQCNRGSAGAKLLLDNVQFLVDLFHCEKHTKSTCMPLENPDCRYHPKLAEEIHGTNTQSCEQGFKRLNKYKYATRKMTENKRNLFFYVVNNEYNCHREHVLKDGGFM
jgi:hypothetical protein